MTQIANAYTRILDRYTQMVEPREGTGKEREVTAPTGGGTFESFLTTQIDRLNGIQVQSDQMIQDFIAGNTEDLHQVMIAQEEARISLELAVQVRNKIVEAYKELNNMQL